MAQIDFHTASYVCLHVFDRTRPVLFVTRSDGDWCLLCGDVHPDDADHFRVVGIGHILESDATLAAILDLGIDEEAEREFVGGSWTRAPLSPEARQ